MTIAVNAPADDNAYGKIQHVAAHDEFAELIEKLLHSLYLLFFRFLFHFKKRIRKLFIPSALRVVYALFARILRPARAAFTL